MHKPTTQTPDKSPVTLQPEAQPPKTAKPTPPSYHEERDELMRKGEVAGPNKKPRQVQLPASKESSQTLPKQLII